MIIHTFCIVFRKKERWLTEKGTYISKKIVNKTWDLFDDIEEELDEGDVPEKFASCYEYMESRLKDGMKKFGQEDHAHVRAIFNSLTSDLGLYEGDDLKLVSAQLYHIGEEIADDDFALPNGFSGVLETLKQHNPEKAFKFSRHVTQINWKDERTARIVCKVNNSVEEFYADHVIVTCSLGHLKQYHDSLFNPALPKCKVDAIERMGFGNVEKVFLYYETPFWKKGDGRFRIAWDTLDDAFKAEYWFKSIFSFREVLTCPNVLLAWVHGSAVQHMESLTDDQIMGTCTEILRKFLNTKDIPHPTKIRRSCWSTDSLFLGAYSYNSVTSQKNDVSDIAEPIIVDGKPVLCFAGEATHVKWFSYAHGARSSGIREADRIIGFIRDNSM